MTGTALLQDIRLGQQDLANQTAGSPAFWQAALHLRQLYDRLEHGRLPGFQFPADRDNFLALWELFPARERFILLSERWHDLLENDRPGRDSDWESWWQEFGHCQDFPTVTFDPAQILPEALLYELRESLADRQAPADLLAWLSATDSEPVPLESLDWAGVRSLMRPLRQSLDVLRGWDPVPSVIALARAGRSDEVRVQLATARLTDLDRLRLTAELWSILRADLSPHEESAVLMGLENQASRLDDAFLGRNLLPALAAAWILAGQPERAFALLSSEDFLLVWKKAFDLLLEAGPPAQLQAALSHLRLPHRRCLCECLWAEWEILHDRAATAHQHFAEAEAWWLQIANPQDRCPMAVELATHPVLKDRPSVAARYLGAALAAYLDQAESDRAESSLWRIHQGYLGLRDWGAARTCEEVAGGTPPWAQSRLLAETWEGLEEGKTHLRAEFLDLLETAEPEDGMALRPGERRQGLLNAWKSGWRDRVLECLKGLKVQDQEAFWAQLLITTLVEEGQQSGWALWYGLRPDLDPDSQIEVLIRLWFDRHPLVRHVFFDLVEEAGPGPFQAETAYRILLKLDQFPERVPETLPSLLRWSAARPAAFLAAWSVTDFFQRTLGVYAEI